MVPKTPLYSAAICEPGKSFATQVNEVEPASACVCNVFSQFSLFGDSALIPTVMRAVQSIGRKRGNCGRCRDLSWPVYEGFKEGLWSWRLDVSFAMGFRFLWIDLARDLGFVVECRL